MKQTIQTIAVLLLMLFLGWFVFSTAIYRFNNPEKTETQLLFDLPKALKGEWGNYNENHE